MLRIPLVIHERLGTWGRLLRPRVVGWEVRVVESRSSTDLSAALAGSPCPLILIDLGDRPRAGLEDLDRVIRDAPDALVLVLDPSAHPGVPVLARELGATYVLTGSVAPPEVVGLLARWLPLAKRRGEADGWSAEPGPEPEPWEAPLRQGP